MRSRDEIENQLDYMRESLKNITNGNVIDFGTNSADLRHGIELLEWVLQEEGSHS